MNAPAVGGEGMSGGQVPDFLREPIATAMNDSLMLALVLAVVGMVACLFFAKPVDKGAWTSGQNAADPHAEAESAGDDSNSSGTYPDAKVTASTEARPADETQPISSEKDAKNPSKP